MVEEKNQCSCSQVAKSSQAVIGPLFLKDCQPPHQTPCTVTDKCCIIHNCRKSMANARNEKGSPKFALAFPPSRAPGNYAAEPVAALEPFWSSLLVPVAEPSLPIVFLTAALRATKPPKSLNNLGFQVKCPLPRRAFPTHLLKCGRGNTRAHGDGTKQREGGAPSLGAITVPQNLQAFLVAMAMCFYGSQIRSLFLPLWGSTVKLLALEISQVTCQL